MTQTQGRFLEQIGMVLYGRRTGWMTRMAEGMGISVGYFNNLHKGRSPMSQELLSSVKALLVKEAFTRISEANRIQIMLESMQGMSVSELSLGPEPEPEPENDDGPAPQNQ